MGVKVRLLSVAWTVTESEAEPVRVMSTKQCSETAKLISASRVSCLAWFNTKLVVGEVSRVVGPTELRIRAEIVRAEERTVGRMESFAVTRYQPILGGVFCSELCVIPAFTSVANGMEKVSGEVVIVQTVPALSLRMVRPSTS